jgi:hypothetical protein
MLEVDRRSAGLKAGARRAPAFVGLARRLGKCLGEPGDHFRVDRIVLRKASGR